MRLNLRQVEAFRAVFQTGSMTAAGDLMGISQPAVSRLIRDLEAEIGLPLFERAAGRVIATPDAVALFREVERSFHGLDRVARAAAELRQRRQGELRIAASVAPSFFCLPPVIRAFHAAWPGVALSLKTGTSPEVLDLVAMQQCDLGVAVVPTDAPGVVTRALPVHEAVCVLPDGHGLAAKPVIGPKDLDGVPLLVLSDYSRLQQQFMACLDAAGVSPNVVFESSFSASICPLIADGVGVGVLDPLTARAHADRGVVLRPFRPAVTYELKAIFPATRPMGERAAAFTKLLDGHLSAIGPLDGSR
ncbi:LysR substrate-binding domain-containing protein [Thalassospiraceae bacterium LMO-SO8]|nr:LysR substrate-binding domain-containing protein [Alphaproteobacteria bacterium LMO-S08]WND74523.1 LysR substrate-binding domain-containing protein [Thalassospiraceae bacterium LMO-SO8]